MKIEINLMLARTKSTITIFKTNTCEKCPSSIWCQDLNPQHSEHKPPPITTRPGSRPDLVS